MMRLIHGIDHIMTLVDDPQKVGASYEKMGFQVRPLAELEGLGRRNRLIMFSDCYMEMMTVHTPTNVNAMFEEFQRAGGGLNRVLGRRRNGVLGNSPPQPRAPPAAKRQSRDPCDRGAKRSARVPISLNGMRDG
jgi:hypothetical protein